MFLSLFSSNTALEKVVYHWVGVKRTMIGQQHNGNGRESGTVSCAMDGLSVGCWEGTEFLCLLEVVLLAG